MKKYNPHRKIKCVETGVTYDNLTLAANSVNRCASAVSQAIANGTLCGGYHWEKIEYKPYAIYKLTFPSGKVYIGQTTKTLKTRWGRGSGYSKNNERMYKDILAIGWDNIKAEELERVDTKEEAIARERHYILQFNSADPEHGYNVQTNIYAAGTDEEIRLHRKQYVREYNNVTNPRKTVICVETGVEYESASEAARQLGLNASHICAVCRGDEGRHTCGGRHWVYGDVID